MNNLEKLQAARVSYEAARVAYEAARASYEAEIEATLGLAVEAFGNILKIPNSDASQGVMKVFAHAALREIGGTTND